MNRLPEIQEELYRVLQQTENELEELPPPPPSNPLGEVLRVLDEFRRDLSERFEGTPDTDGLLQNIRPHTTKFRRRIRATAPDFVPWESHRAGQPSVMPAATFLSNEEESESDALHDGPVESVGSEIHVDQVMDRAQTSVFSHFHCVQNRLTKVSSRSRTRELPDHYPFVVQKTYIAEFVKEWRQPALTLFDAVYQILKQDIERLVDKHFGKMGRGGAKQSVLCVHALTIRHGFGAH